MSWSIRECNTEFGDSTDRIEVRYTGDGLADELIVSLPTDRHLPLVAHATRFALQAIENKIINEHNYPRFAVMGPIVGANR